MESLKSQKPIQVEKRTHVADWTSLNIGENETVQIYDEGGQDVYRITSSIFNAPNSTPMLMHDATKVSR